MGQAKRDPQLESRTNRLKLKPRKEPYWSRLQEGQHIGYYRPGNKAAGSWLAKWRNQETGERKQTTLGPADDYADGGGSLSWAQAQAKAREWFEQAGQDAAREAGGEAVPRGPYTVADALRDYFADGERRGMKGLTRDVHRAALWILPELGPLSVAALTRTRLENWLAKVAESPRQVRTKRPPEPGTPAPKPRNFRVPRPPKPSPVPAPPSAPATSDEKRARKDSANRVLTVLKAALNHALDRRKVRGGEAWQSVKPYRGVGKARVRFLAADEQVRLVNACAPVFRPLVQGALLTGARYGELASLRVEDFNPAAGTVFIEKSKNGKPRHVVLTDEGRALFTELTSGRSAGELVFLRDGVARRKRESLGGAWGQSDQGRFMREACKVAKLEALSFHELRHSYASMLVNAGCPLAYVAAQLGHSDTRMVEKHYGHLAPSALADSIRALMPKLGLVETPKVEPLCIKRA